MGRTWKSMLGSLIVGLLGIVIYRYLVYETAIYQMERLGERAREMAHQLQSQSINALRPAPPVKRPLTEAEKLEMRRKEAFEKAFDANYTPPKECEHWKTDRHMVECVNHRIRAKKAFREEYGANFEMTERIDGNWVR